MKGKDWIPVGYVPSGELSGIPMEIIERMLECQYNLSGCVSLGSLEEGVSNSFNFAGTIEGWDFWNKVLNSREYGVFFERYPELRYVYKVKEDDLIGWLSGFPVEVAQKMVDNQYMQTGVSNVLIFQNNVTAGVCSGGFYWGYTIEGECFWRGVIEDKDFSTFFKKYPKVDNTCDKSPYIVKEEDITGDLTGLPIEIVQLMVKRQFEQTGKCDISVFQENRFAATDKGGFSWKETEEGFDAWGAVIYDIDSFNKAAPMLRNAFREKRPTYVYVTNSSAVDNPSEYRKRVFVTINNGKAYTWANASSIEMVKTARNILSWDHYLTEEQYDELDRGIVELTIEDIEKRLNVKKGCLKIKE